MAKLFCFICRFIGTCTGSSVKIFVIQVFENDNCISMITDSLSRTYLIQVEQNKTGIKLALHDNCPSHHLSIVTDFSEQDNIFMESIPCAPDSVDCNYSRVPRVYLVVKGNRYVGTNAIQIATTSIFNND